MRVDRHPSSDTAANSTRPDPNPVLDLPAIELPELLERAALQDRMDRKYLLPIGEMHLLVDQLRDDARVLQIDGRRDFAYESVYFDTPDLVCYLQAARRRRRRFKVRTRTYVDAAECYLEVKTRDHRGHTVKYRQTHDADLPTTLTRDGRAFTDLIVATTNAASHDDLDLNPTLITSYRRSTLFLPSSNSRMTIDTDLRWTLDSGATLTLPGMTIVETKTASRPSAADRLLWRGGRRPTLISKYGTGLAALRPDLPAAKWNRILRRHFPAVDAG